MFSERNKTKQKKIRTPLLKKSALPGAIFTDKQANLGIFITSICQYITYLMLFLVISVGHMLYSSLAEIFLEKKFFF